MKIYLKSIVSQLRKYSATLDKTSILVDKPWALVDDEFEMQKLIFKKNKELVLSKNGQVQIGKWEYFPEAKSLLIDRNSDKILCNEAFIDKAVMVLRLDGTDSKFFILANENLVPDLDANQYLKKLRYQKLKIVETKLVDGRILEVSREVEYHGPQIGNQVTMEANPIEDGKYQLAEACKYYEVRKGRIFKFLTATSYTNTDNYEIIVHQQDSWKIKNGDEVFIFDKRVENAIVNFSNTKNLVVRDGKVIRIERKNVVTRYLSKKWKQFWSYYDE
jgi:hypothetical protein